MYIFTFNTKAESNDDPVKWNDSDDYLVYLEDILQQLHRAFYKMYDKHDTETATPDLRRIIPAAKRKVYEEQTFYSVEFPFPSRLSIRWQLGLVLLCTRI